jgi:hypothetical protein
MIPANPVIPLGTPSRNPTPASAVVPPAFTKVIFGRIAHGRPPSTDRAWLLAPAFGNEFAHLKGVRVWHHKFVRIRLRKRESKFT